MQVKVLTRHLMKYKNIFDGEKKILEGELSKASYYYVSAKHQF